MDPQRKYAYRYLLYSATLDIRPLAWLPQGLFRARSWNPRAWRQDRQRVRFAGAVADWMHNLALYSAVEFAGFNEEWFWRDFHRLAREFPDFVPERYRQLFDQAVGEYTPPPATEGQPGTSGGVKEDI